jgi:hypothetical protein
MTPERHNQCEKAADAAEPGELGVGDERLAAARAAVVMEENLIGFEIGADECGGIVGAARIRPCGELAQRPAMGVDGRLRVGACGEVGEKGVGVGGDALWSVGLRGMCAALLSAAHGGEVGESGWAWQGGEWWRNSAQEVSENPIDKDLKVDNFEGMNRLTIEIEPEQHRQIKTLATFSGMTIKEFILSKTLGPQQNASGDATDRLMGSAKNAARLREAMATPDSEHRVFKSLEDLKNALGI